MINSRTSSRREFLRKSVATGAVVGLAPRFARAKRQVNETAVRSYRELGRTGLKISDISFGASRLRSDGAHLVKHALERGINYFDTAYR